MARPSPERLYTATISNYSTGWGFVNNFMRTDERYYRAWSGTRTPGFRRKKPRDLPINNHTSHIVKWAHASFRRQRVKLGGSPGETDDWYDGYQMLAGRPSGAPSMYDSVPDWSAFWRAHGQCMDEVLDRKFNFAQFVAERQQVVRMVNDTALRLGRAARALRRGNLSAVRDALGYKFGPKRSTGDIHKDWLAFQYGWKPLLSDVKGAAEHLAQNHLGRPLVLRVSKSAKGIVPGETVMSTPVQPSSSYWSRGETQSRFKVYLEYEVSNDFIRQGSQLGLTDPLTLAWELTPWSFVADWFIPIGTFLSRLQFDSGLSFKKGGYTSFNKTINRCGVVTGVRNKVESDGTYRETWSQDAGYVSKTDVTYLFRVRYDTSPTPKFPSFKDPFSATHVLNALALMRGSFGKH